MTSDDRWIDVIPLLPALPMPHCIIGFYNPGVNTPVDQLCGCGLFGNFIQQPQYPITIDGLSYLCAEAAFQALKLTPEHRARFQNLTGAQAFTNSRKCTLMLHFLDPSIFAWQTMMRVLSVKFSHPQNAQALIATGTAILIEHNDGRSKDAIWSNKSDGTGSNLLGFMLMHIRELLGGQHSPWKPFLEGTMNLSTGQFLSANKKNIWQAIVMRSTLDILDAIQGTPSGQLNSSPALPMCGLPGCTKSCFVETNGRVHDFCGTRHRDEFNSASRPSNSSRILPICGLPGCMKSCSIDGRTGRVYDFCGARHRDQFFGSAPSSSSSSSHAVPICGLPSCGKPCFVETNGKVHNYCGRNCARRAGALP